MRAFIGCSALGVALFALSGCDWMDMYEKEKWIVATSRPGWDTFTFKGQLPAEFGIDAIAFYGPNDPDKASCQTVAFDEPGKAVVRRHVEQYTAEIKGQAQDFSFEIPLSYYKGLCGMRLGRVKLEIKGRHGPLDWQKTYGLGGFYIVTNTTKPTAEFDHTGTFNLTGTCSWWFQQSHARSRLGEIEKILNCRNANGYLLSENLANKKVNLKIVINPEEEPSHDDTWIRFPNGWKPCAAKDGWRWCRKPIKFQTFKMNGKTCTVYPGCKE